MNKIRELETLKACIRVLKKAQKEFRELNDYSFGIQMWQGNQKRDAWNVDLGFDQCIQTLEEEVTLFEAKEVQKCTK